MREARSYFLLAALLLTFSNGYAEEAASPVVQPVKSAEEKAPPAGQAGKPEVAAPTAGQPVKTEEKALPAEQTGKPEATPPTAGQPVTAEEKTLPAEQAGRAAVAAPVAGTAKPEGANPFADQIGKWSFSMNDPGPDLKKLSSAARNKLRKELQDIAAIVTATPAMNPPRGYEARFWGSITGKDRFDICTGKECPPSRPNASLAMMIGRYEAKNGKKRAAFNTPSTMDISINNLGHVFAHLPVIYKDKAGFLLPEPQRDGERLGMPVYLNNGHAVAVLTRIDKSFWLPVSRERYLKAAMDDIAKDLGLPSPPPKKGKKQKAEELGTTAGNPILVEESRSWVDPASEKELVESSQSLAEEVKDSASQLQERMNQLQSELDALTPEQRSMQARVDIKIRENSTEVTLLPPDSSSGVAVVTPDFGFFNKKLAPEAVQLVVVQWKFDGDTAYDPEKSGISETLNNRTLLEIYRSMDWQKLLGKTGKVTRTAP